MANIEAVDRSTVRIQSLMGLVSDDAKSDPQSFLKEVLARSDSGQPIVPIEVDGLLAWGASFFPDDEMIAIHYAWQASRRGDWEEALSRWIEMGERFTDHWMALTGRGEAERELGRLDDAEGTLQKAMSLYSNIDMPFIHYAWVSTRRRNWIEAFDRWNLMLERFPNSKVARTGAIEALFEMNRLEDTDSQVDVGLETSPNDTDLLAWRDRSAKRRIYNSQSPAQRVRAAVEATGILSKLDRNVANPEVLIEITSICNFACTYCVSPMKLREKKHMTMDIFRKVMEQVAAITTKPICMHVDGEPTSHPHFHEMALHVNSYGLPVSLATNGSYLSPEFLDIWMDPLISMSTSAEELAKRHRKMNFNQYTNRIARYVAAWCDSTARQNIFFQIIYYPQGDANQSAAYGARKNEFIFEFCKHAGVYDFCTEESQVTDEVYRLRRKGTDQVVAFIKQGLTTSGLYPVDGKLVERERAREGFCDSPWRQLVVHSNGTLGACCSDLSGGTSFASKEDVLNKSIGELWQSSPQINQLRQSFLEGRVERDVCQRCLKQEDVFVAERG